MRIQNMLVYCLFLWAASVAGILVACSPTPSLDDLPAGAPTAGIVFVSNRDGDLDLYRMSAGGGSPQRLTNSQEVDGEPRWSPDGTRIAFRSRIDGSSDIFLMDPEGKHVVNLIGDPADSFDDEFNPHWSPDGQKLAIFTDRPPLAGCTGHMLAVMSLDKGADGIIKSGTSSESFTWAPDGASVTFSSPCTDSGLPLKSWVFDAPGFPSFQPDTGLPFVAHPAYSPAGDLLAFQGTVGDNSDIYVLDLETGHLRRLTDYAGKDTHPTWSPDGHAIAFTTDRDGNEEIYVMTAEGDALRNLTNNPARDSWPDWSPVPQN